MSRKFNINNSPIPNKIQSKFDLILSNFNVSRLPRLMSRNISILFPHTIEIIIEGVNRKQFRKNRNNIKFNGNFVKV